MGLAVQFILRVRLRRILVTCTVGLLIIGYLTPALIVPIALLQLARTGQPPSSLGLSRHGSKRDAIESVGLYAGVWVLNLVLITPLFLLIGDSLTNSEHDTHVPAY